MVHNSLPLNRQIRRCLIWLWKQKGTKGQRARGLAAGVFCGCFPLFGLQTVLGIALASILKGNHLLAAVGTWISNPFTYLPLYWFNYTVGCKLLGQLRSAPDLSNFSFQTIWHQGWAMSSRLILGSTLVGFFFAGIVGWISYQLLNRLSAMKKSHHSERMRI